MLINKENKALDCHPYIIAVLFMLAKIKKKKKTKSVVLDKNIVNSIKNYPTQQKYTNIIILS